MKARATLGLVRNTPVPRDSAARDRIHRIWDELAAFEASESEAALLYLLGAVAKLITAQNAVWIGVLRMSDDRKDPLNGWRARAIRYLHPTTADQASGEKAMRRMRGVVHDPSTAAHLRMAGRFHVVLQREVMPDWHESETYLELYAPRGIIDMLTVGAPVNPWAESYYLFHRKRPRRAFTAQDRDTVAYAMRSLTWFHRQVLLSHGLLAAHSPLSPAERRMLAALLSQRTEKEIAATLRLTHATAHTYIQQVFRKFGVGSRAGLTALWLGQAR